MGSIKEAIDRNQWLDIAKGITIILMVVGHTAIPKVVGDFIWAFHMPLFFIASGWCTNWGKYRLIDFVFYKLRSLGIPFVIYSILVLVINISLFEFEISDWIRNGWEGYALWFIPVLYSALVLSKIVMMIRSDIQRVILSCSILVVGFMLNKLNVQLPWNMSTVPYAAFLILLGSWCKVFNKWFETPKWWILFAGFIITCLISHFWRLDMAWNNINPVIPLTIGALSGTAMIFTFSSYLSKYTDILSYVLKAVGKETYIILAFSQIIIMLMNNYISSNTIVKYTTLILVLVALSFIKERVNSLIGKEIF